MQRSFVPFREPLVDLTAWRSQYLSQPEVPASGWLLEALQAFQVFARQYQAYFEDLIKRGEIDTGRTTVFHLREQVEQALEVYRAPLERVAIQRQVAEYREELDVATAEAAQYLTKLGLKGEVLIYFDKVALVQQLPYTHVPIIGIPYRLIPLQNESERKGDWLAIPHELGHYVFWHLAEPENLNRQQQAVKDEVQRAVQQALGNQQLDDLLAQSLEPILMGWTEELFADVMGTYLGGEPFLDSLKLLIRHNIGNSDELRISDVSHPHHCLRPMVRLHVLKHLGVDVTKQEAEWDAFFRETLGVARLAQLKLRANSPTLITDPAKLNKAAALAMLSGQPTVAFTAAQVRPALEAAIDSLCQTADRVLAAGLQIPPIDPSLAFEQLQLQSPAATKAGPAPYLTLLQPRTLQGGDWHSHGAWVLDGHPWWTWHDCGVHFH